MENSEIIIYQSEDGYTKIEVRMEGETVWLTLNQLAELFQTTKQNISLHIKNIYSEGELHEAATVKEYLTVQQEGTRSVKRVRGRFNNFEFISVYFSEEVQEYICTFALIATILNKLLYLTHLQFSAVDLFCGIGGLSKGLIHTGIKVKAGIDVDETCRYAYEKNNNADFVCKDITTVKGDELLDRYWPNEGDRKILVGCAPCQPFSAHANKLKNKSEDRKWNLLSEFARIIVETNPDIISMENVPNLQNQKIFLEFINLLREKKYYVSYSVAYCPDYGIPQKRKRLVLFASKFGKLDIIRPTHTPQSYKTVRDAIGGLPSIKAGEVAPDDPLHRTTNLSDINLERIRSSKPNGTWRDWAEHLLLPCHRKETGASYQSVYGRMAWDEPSPTITTQFYNFGTGRFGHPEQDRALTIREASLLQTFPKDYTFFQVEEEIFITRLGVHIGNAVPVRLGEVIGESILKHISTL